MTSSLNTLYLPPSLLILVHLHILDYAHANNAEYDHNVFSPRTRGLRERAKTMEDICYFLVRKIEGKGVKTVLSSYPCSQPSESLAFRTSLAKYLENLRHRNTKSSDMGSAPWWKDVVVRKSLLEECSGDKFARLMLSLSTHALMTTSRPLTPSDHHSMSALLRDEPVAYATALAKYQAACHAWAKKASLISRSEFDLKALRERLESAPSSNYSSLSTARLKALAQSTFQDLLQRHWTGVGGKEALLFLIELAGLRSGVDDSLHADAGAISQVISLPLTVAAAHHPTHLKRLRRPIFQSKETARKKSRPHSEILLSGYVESSKQIRPTLVAALSKAKNTTLILFEKLLALQHPPVDIQSSIGFWTVLHDQTVDIDYNPRVNKELIEVLGLQPDYEAFDDASTEEDAVEKRIHDIRTSILPVYPPMPDLSAPPYPSRDLKKPSSVSVNNAKAEGAPTRAVIIPKNTSEKNSALAVLQKPSVEVLSAEALRTPAVSPGKSSRSLRRKSMKFSMTRRRTTRPSMFAVFGGELDDEVDKLVDETHDFPTDDESTENERSSSPSYKTPRAKSKQKVNRIWTAGTPMPSTRKGTPQVRMPSALTRRLEMEPSLSMPSLPSSASSIFHGTLGSADDDGEWLAKDVDATPRPVRRNLPQTEDIAQPPEHSPDEEDDGDRHRFDGTVGDEAEDEDFFEDDPPSMTLKEILLSADSSHFDLLEEADDDIGGGMLVEDSSFVWE